MKFQVCSIYDSKARAFMLPMFFTHCDVAKRAFADAANQESAISKNPEDYTLFHIGVWNDTTGEFEPLPQHVNLGLASAYKRS